jgi:chemotaxis protein MotB
MVRLSLMLFLTVQALWGCVSLNQYGALREAYDKLESENQAGKKDLGKVSSELKRAQQDLAALKQASEELARQAKDHETQAKNLEAGLQQATQENAELAKQLEAAKAALASKEDEMGKTVRSLESALQEEIAKGSSAVKRGENSISVEIADRVLYESGSADITSDGLNVLKRVGEALKGSADKDIRVEGHTDDVPIRTEPPPRFPSNWDLSVARAVGVVKYLEEKAGMNPARLSAVGYGPNRPAVPNENDEARARNRRVEIILTPAQPPPGSPPPSQ